MMKFIKYMGHPVLLMSFYLLLLIESKYFGGFYLLYILMALPAGSLFAYLALLGLVLVFIGYKMRPNNQIGKPILYFVGLIILVTSLLIFFKQSDRLATFELLIPTITFLIFSISSICFLINTAFLIKVKHLIN